MERYFIEVAYKGTRYSGFQVQENSATIQSEVENAFVTLHRRPVELTGSSRTDAGVHALQNYFHFDFPEPLHPQFIYKMNAILPADIVMKNVFHMPADAHARFDATSRRYQYRLHRFKNPFLKGISWYYPYQLDLGIMTEAVAIIREQTNFFAFAKTNSQVKNFNCSIQVSSLHTDGDELVYEVEANRFLRGMVRLLTASVIRTGRKQLTLGEFIDLFRGDRKCGYSVPAHGLFLKEVKYPENYFPSAGLPLGAF